MAEKTIEERLEALEGNQNALAGSLGCILFQYTYWHLNAMQEYQTGNGLMLHDNKTEDNLFIKPPLNKGLATSQYRLQIDCKTLRQKLSSWVLISIYQGEPFDIYDQWGGHIILSSPNIKKEDLMYAFQNAMTEEEALAVLEKKGETK